MANGTLFDFADLQRVLLDWPARELPPADCGVAPPLVGRLLQMLRDAHSIGRIRSAPDLIVLIRHLLLARSKQQMIETLRVPTGCGWPTSSDWKRFGFSVIEVAAHLMVEPSPWVPAWLGISSTQSRDIFTPEFEGKRARRSAEVPMDPFLRAATGFAHYVCPGQREAVRSLLFMSAGSTLIVNLPTGSGKSLVGQAPVLLYGLHRGLTLFVVPTTALALDLERRTRELLLRRHAGSEIPLMAWFSGRSDEAKQAIKQRIRDGTQGILFASPEAITGSLLPALYQAAKQGLLKYLVVDEAHLVAQWGDGFRPAFQMLSGVRRGLLQACASERFRTVLMSATYSRQIVATLEAMFGPADDVQMVSAVHLRPEPRYFSYFAKNEEDKRIHVLELLRHVPRPFILYTTKRADAQKWLMTLQEEGYRRIACFHGETPDMQREQVIDQWVQDRLDGIVATSAFGVGMDKQDVRTVIHAALPETLDRLYQEVGRGGRDGCASLSITVFDQTDVGVARSMSKPTIIGDDNAFERWRTMFLQAHTDPQRPGIRFVDIRKRPPHVVQESDYNRDWNMRTLILMVRAGLIELDSSSPIQIERTVEEDDRAFQARREAYWEEYFSLLPLRTIDPKHLDHEHFEHRIGSERERGTEAADRYFQNLTDALHGHKEMGDVLTELFTCHDPGRTVLVSTACRGCPATRGTLHRDGAWYQIPSGIGIDRVRPSLGNEWHRRFTWLEPSMVVVLCPADRRGPGADVLRALEASVALFGVAEVAAFGDAWRADLGLSTLHRAAQDGVLIARDLDEEGDVPPGLPLPRATLLLPWDTRPIPDHLYLLNRPLHLVFAPEDIADSRHPLRRFRDTSTNCLDLEDFLRMVTQ